MFFSDPDASELVEENRRLFRTQRTHESSRNVYRFNKGIYHSVTWTKYEKKLKNLKKNYQNDDEDSDWNAQDDWHLRLESKVSMYPFHH